MGSSRGSEARAVGSTVSRCLCASLGDARLNELVVPLVDPAGGHLYAIVPLLVRRDDGPDRVPQLLQGVLDADTGADWNEW